jgi:hypothetical protein
MKYLFQALVIFVGLFYGAIYAVASPDVEQMSDIEVSEYAVHMSKVLEKIQYRQLCASHDTHCVRAEFARHGLSYDDKVSVQKRLIIMVGGIR